MRFRWLLLLLLLLILTSTVCIPSCAQEGVGAPPQRQALIEKIRETARRHVEADSGMQTQAVLEMYSHNAEGVSTEEVGRIYEEEYTRLKAARRPTISEQIKGNAGWAAAAILGLLLIFRDALKDWITQGFKKLGAVIYARWAGSPVLRRVALRKYREKIASENTEVHIPFRPNLPLQIQSVYVPIKVSGFAESKLASDAVARNKRLMVVGAPGSGKTMMLKHLAHSYAQSVASGQPIPILLELEKMNDSGMTVEQHLAKEMEINHFPCAERFLASALEKGAVLLLLDGLDEVNATQRQRIVGQMKDFFVRFDACRAAITCRKHVYNGEFAEVVDRTVEIDEFRDQDIRRFLRSWKMPENKSVEQLLQTLQDRPTIKALARNPLLLTIIAHLYSDTNYELPQSRAQFYKTSADVLLQVWHRELNQFQPSDKRVVLRALALFNQERAVQPQQDRLSMDRTEVLQQVRIVLPGVSISEQQAPAILSEVVERSGLLLSIDGGERYQFAHLTLQEFFAAERLADTPEDLVARFREAPDKWREPVKLWCGLAADSSNLIRDVCKIDPTAAFECLAEAQYVDPVMMNDIVNKFRSELGRQPADDAVTRAFGAVASHRNARGGPVFAFLAQTLDSSPFPERRRAAAQALSLTNLSVAARLLANRGGDQDAREQLVRMGDLAIPELVPLADGGSADAVRGLFLIGTPQAAGALVPFLWHTVSEVSLNAAWYLAAMSSQPEVEVVLREFRLSTTHRQSPILTWLWQQPDEPPFSSLPTIVSRSAYLISKGSGGPVPHVRTVDPRIGVPLCTVLAQDEWKRVKLDAVTDWAEFVKLRSAEPSDATAIKFVDEALSKMSASARLRGMLARLPQPLQFDVVRRMMQGAKSGRVPSEEDWRTINQPAGYALNTGWHLRTVLGFVGALTAVAVYEIVRQFVRGTSVGHSVFLVALVLGVLAFWGSFLWSPYLRDDTRLGAVLAMFGMGFLFLALAIAVNVEEYWKRRHLDLPKGIIPFLVLAPICSTTVFWFSGMAVYRLGGWYPVGAIYTSLVLATALLVWLGLKRERAAKNPLRGVLAAAA